MPFGTLRIAKPLIKLKPKRVIHSVISVNEQQSVKVNLCKETDITLPTKISHGDK